MGCLRQKNFTTKLPRTTLGTGLARTQNQKNFTRTKIARTTLDIVLPTPIPPLGSVLSFLSVRASPVPSVVRGSFVVKFFSSRCQCPPVPCQCYTHQILFLARHWARDLVCTCVRSVGAPVSCEVGGKNHFQSRVWKQGFPEFFSAQERKKEISQPKRQGRDGRTTARRHHTGILRREECGASRRPP